MTFDDRLKAARAELKLKQEDVVAQTGIPIDTYRKYEGGKRLPGADALAALAKLGINVHWLVTASGEMLVPTGITTGMKVQDAANPQYQVAPAKINAKALAAIIEGVVKAQPAASPARLAMLAAEFYVKALDEGYITPEGVGDGPLSDSA